mmetsp:Transcript_9308/g.12951  ORF Transcript_9308/g.12951 Transcript_9308/m.12951 type:complete len:108 (-) Transcript_9308:1062-1385(-)
MNEFTYVLSRRRLQRRVLYLAHPPLPHHHYPLLLFLLNNDNEEWNQLHLSKKMTTTPSSEGSGEISSIFIPRFKAATWWNDLSTHLSSWNRSGMNIEISTVLKKEIN